MAKRHHSTAQCAFVFEFAPALPTSKACTKCREVKPFEDFQRLPKGRLGRHSWCRACENAVALAKYHATYVRKTITAPSELGSDGKPAAKQCNVCKQMKPLGEFSPQRRGLHGVRGLCKPCAAAIILRQTKARREANGYQTPETKRCATCSEVKAAAAFNKGTGPTGLHASCRICARVVARNRRACRQLPEVIIASKACSMCGQIKLTEEFLADKASSTGLTSRCRSCHNENTLRWNRENPDKFNAIHGRRRARKKDALPSWLTPAHHAEMEGLYFWCSIFPGHQVDHIVPLQGKNVCGLHVPLNLQVLPAKENMRKGNRFNG